MDIQGNTSVTQFLSLYSKKHTVDGIKSNLKAYLKVVTGKEARGLQELDAVAKDYFLSRDFAAIRSDVEKFFVSIKDRPPKTIPVSLSHVRNFLMHNDIELKQIFWRDLQRKVKGGAVTVDEVRSNEKMAKIVRHLLSGRRPLFSSF